MAAASPLQALLTDETLLPILWPHLTPCCRAEVFFTCRAARAAVLSTATRFVAEAESQQELNELWALLVAASQPAPAGQAQSWMQQIMHAPNVTTRLCANTRRGLHGRAGQQCDVTHVLRAHLPAPSTALVQELQLGIGAVPSADDLAFIGTCMPQLHTLILDAPRVYGYTVTALPPPTALPHLQHLVFTKSGIADSSRISTLISSLAPYMAQLVELQLPDPCDTATLMSLFSLAAPAAPNLKTLRVLTQLSDDLLQLLNCHAPQLHTLAVTAPPSAPLQQPCHLRTLTFLSLTQVSHLAYIPQSVAHVSLSSWTLGPGVWLNANQLCIDVSTDQEADGVVLAAQLVNCQRELWKVTLAADTKGSEDLGPLRSKLRVLDALIPLWKLQGVCVALQDWVASKELLAVLPGLLPSLSPQSFVSLSLQWLPDPVLYSNLLAMFTHCAGISLMQGTQGSGGARYLSAAQVDAMLAGLPADPGRERMLDVWVQAAPGHSFEMEGVMGRHERQWRASGSHPNVTVLVRL